LRLVAIDGTILTVPKNKETIKEFGDNVLSKNGKWLKAQASFATDVLNNICLDADLKSYKTAEKDMAETHLNSLGKYNLYLFDRGYFSREFLWKIFQTGNHFCFRVSRTACKEVIEFIKSKEKDIISEINTKNGKIKVRLTKVKLNKQEEEYLVTSLRDIKTFSALELKRLYHLRWGIEEQYKDMKYALSIENFTGKKVNSVKQDFFGNILMYNISMMTCKKVIDRKSNKLKKNKKSKKRKYKTNKRALLAKIKQCFIDLFLKSIEIEIKVENIINIVTKESVPIRKARSYKRNATFKAKFKHCKAYGTVI